jgi:hypothetical protein
MEKINKEELLKWANETIIVYNQQKTNFGYYTQTPLSLVSQSPDILILGINPGYTGGINNKTGEDLLKGNPCFKGKDKKGVIEVMKEEPDENKNRKGWALWHRLNNMLSNSDNIYNKCLLEHFDRFVLSNMIFFGTEKESQIPKIEREECAKRTMKLISILNPKLVLLLGSECRKLFNRIAEKKLDILVPNSIYHCMYGKSHVLSIKHTAFYYSNEEMVLVGKTIGYVLDHYDETINTDTISASYIKEDIIHFEERQKKKQSQGNIKKSDDLIVERAKELKQIIKSKGANKNINSDGTLEYEYYCYSKTNGKFLKENGIIVVGLRYDIKKQQYVLCFKSMGNNPDVLMHKIKVYCSKENLFKPDMGNDTVLYEDATFKVETIANFMDGLLAMIKTYRETDSPK